ncbi:Lactose transport system permease protein LacF [bioreactor metagenome]|uniref:Lactose transport system permease protein LacF n=1 Tax=bioreactor metagenome TaxID=1076179 RepID=A0A645JEN3_9ZZZZ
MGYTIMLYIVAIQKIPAEMYEAAEIDGANRVQRFFAVTMPQVREMLFVTMVTTVSGAFLVFNDVYILTKGGPGNSSVTLAVYMYNMAFTQDRMGYASSIAILMLIICLLLALIQKQGLRSGEVD